MTERLVYLSHPLGSATPTFGANPPVRVTALARHDRGDGFTQSVIETLNHNGTHVDAPLHFNPEGSAVSELPPETWHFEAPVLVDLETRDDELLDGPRLEPHVGQLASADAVLIRTGHGRFRVTDPDRYTSRNPGFTPGFGEFLLACAPHLRALLCDLPSCAAARAIDPGLEFHRVMLGRKRGDRFVLLFEDVRLPADLPPPRTLWALPLLLENLDGAPATIVAVIDEPAGAAA